jgi:AcrR family transcriptional regulator
MGGRREQTTQRILDGAAAAFAKGGYAATSMAGIAVAAGVSKLLLYRDFAGKRELYQAVLERTLSRIEGRVPARASNESLRELIATARADPDGFVLVFRHAAREPEFADFVAGHLRRHVEVSQQLLRTIEPDPALRRWAAQMTVTITYQAIIAWLEHGDPRRDEEFYQRLLAVNRTAAKPLPAPDPAPQPDPGPAPNPAPARRPRTRRRAR